MEHARQDWTLARSFLGNAASVPAPSCQKDATTTRDRTVVGGVLQAAFCATSILFTVSNAQAVDGYAQDASTRCAIFKPNLRTSETVTFQGPCASGFGEGRGVAKWSGKDGTTVTFEGNFVQGKLHGPGIMVTSSGDRYQGNYKDGKREGFGVYTSANGDQFTGQYKDNLRHGQGILTLGAGAVTKGEWQNGMLVSVTSESSPGAGAAGPKQGPPQAAVTAPQLPQAATAPPTGPAGRQPSATSRSRAGPESSSTTSSEKIGAETVAILGATLRVERCGRLPVTLGADPTTSVVAVKLPRSIDVQNTTRSGNYNASQAGGGVFPILMEAFDIIEKNCQLKHNPLARKTDVYMYIDQLPPPGTKWPSTLESWLGVSPSSVGNLVPKPSLTATRSRGEWRVKNLVLDAYVKEQQAEQQARQQEQQAKQQEQQRQAQLAAQAEAQKKESDRNKEQMARIVQFAKKHNLANKEPKGLGANPFAFEGDRLLLVTAFEQMHSATTGIFYTNEGVVVVADIPRGTFVTKEKKVLLAAKVLGNVRFDGVVGGLLPVNGMVPNLKYLGAIVCRDQSCNETTEK